MFSLRENAIAIDGWMTALEEKLSGPGPVQTSPPQIHDVNSEIHFALYQSELIAPRQLDTIRFRLTMIRGVAGITHLVQCAINSSASRPVGTAGLSNTA